MTRASPDPGRTSLADALAVARNEAARAWLRAAIRAAGHALRIDLRARVAGHARDQARLARAYGIGAATPIVGYGDDVRRSIEAFAARCAARGVPVRFAATSGSTSTPKRIAFTAARLRAIRLGSFSVAARTLLAYGVRRPGLFILAGIGKDDSLSSLLLDADETARPPYLAGLLMPARHLGHPALAPLLRDHGATAVRLLLLALADPGILYSTNPSTLAVFLAQVHERWEESTALARRFARERAGLDPAVVRVARRVVSPGFATRLERIAAARAPLPVAAWLPGLECYACWDGGYVRPFLDRIEAYLPAGRFRHVPMYSMSTETVETLTDFDRAGRPRFLPIAPRVLYEFVPEGAEDAPSNLVAAADLEPGRAYAMVVSDPYGLVRYQTDDLFLCAGKVGAVPDLRFLRRRGLSYSFTGEKLTGEQLTETYDALRAAVSSLREAGVQMTCFPSLPPALRLPRYRLVLAHPGARAPADLAADGAGAAIGTRFDRMLGERNREFEAKLSSGRLGPTQVVVASYDALAARLHGRAGEGRAWESQFKLLPLYRRLYEDVFGGEDAAP